MTSARSLMWLRMLVGLLFMRQGLIHVKELVLDNNFALVSLVQSDAVRVAWPIVGGLRPMELTLWAGGLEFALGMFVFGGLLTRACAAALTVIALFWLVVLRSAGVPITIYHGLLLVAAALIFVKGGGPHTMDSELGRMQRRSLEREAERESAARSIREGPA